MSPDELKPAYRPSRLIINGPFDEPSRYWRYDRQTLLFNPVDGRRPAGYLIASPDARGFNDPGVFVELPLVNRIRPRIKAWREAGYPGTTAMTRRLLEHWSDLSQRDNRFFFCQLEAIETLIWLTEAAPSESQGIEVRGDGGPFERWCTKLATGTGKTVVMAMLIAWQVLNKVADAASDRYAKHILVVAPGLTVRSRLSVLVPDSPGNYYDEFGIVPAAMYDQLRQGKVLVTIGISSIGKPTHRLPAKGLSINAARKRRGIRARSAGGNGCGAKFHGRSTMRRITPGASAGNWRRRAWGERRSKKRRNGSAGSTVFTGRAAFCAVRFFGDAVCALGPGKLGRIAVRLDRERFWPERCD